MTERESGTQKPAGDPSDGREIPHGTDEGVDANPPTPKRADRVPKEERENDQRQPNDADSEERR